MILLLVAVLADRQQGKVLLQDSWEQVGITLETTRSRFERRLDTNIEILHELAGKLGSSEDIPQSGFELLAESAFGERPEALVTEFSPDFVTTFVYPVEGNRARIGRDLRDKPGPASAPPRLRSQLGAFMYGPVKLEDGTSVLGLHLPLLKLDNDPVSVVGAISVLLDIEAMFRLSGIPDPDGETEYLVLFENDAEGAQNILHGSMGVMEDSPVTSEISFPYGHWTILARPYDGWRPDREAQRSYRLLLLALGVIILVPALFANRFAVARRESILELEAAKTQLSGVLHNMPGVVFTYRMPPGHVRPGPTDEIYFFQRESCTEIWGIDATILENDIVKLWSLVSDEDALERFLDEIAQSATELREWHFVWPTRMPDGTEKWLEGRGHPTKLPDGATLWYSLIIDVTEEVERKAELEHQKELAYLAQKNDSLGKLTGGVAHDFNNLLAVIMGNQELLRDALTGGPDARPDLLEFVDNSLKASERGAGLTRKMLAFARRARLEPAVLDLNQVVRETAAWAGRTMPESIQVVTEFDEALPKVKLDRGSSENALLNLMVNARDAMPEGGTLTISTSAVSLKQDDPVCGSMGLEPGTYVRLVVEDTGTGISPEILPRIYEPFFSTKPLASGSGLGLSMVQGFMEQSGGAVQVTSEREKGTRFELYFRAMKAGTVSDRMRHDPAPAMPHRKRRILLVEDESDVRKVLSSILSAAGYALIEAETGDDAFELFKQSPDVDLLLTDIVMPGKLQGSDLAGAIRGMVPNLPVLFLSGYDVTSDKTDNGSREPDIWLTKPVSRNALIRAVERALGQGADGQAGTREM
ncbi:ATP-binding protein [Aliiruegeria sabulilitoris]|uniref:ATP-binding protein n=1 Tax=Aliiruegeria sabulilitoris TaxID=1510458 RepID=UPI0018D2496E|nr:ATP-binding protein [Aliiruegeria sabulilitoris]